MVKSTIDEIKDITLERQIRKLAGVIDEQNQKIEAYGDATTDINNLKTSDTNQNIQINNLKATIAEHTTDIDNLKASDTNQAIQINNLKQTVATDKLATDSAITALQNKDVEQDGTITDHATQIQGITESLVSGVQIMSGTTTGDIKVRLERESAAAIDSNNYNLGLPVSAEIIQGTGPSMFKIQITMSSGVKVVSNDFVFTTEAIGNDVYISSFTFKAGNQSGYLSADIGLNNGVTIEANNFLVPTDPNVTSAIADLQTRLTTVENSGVTDISGLKTTVSEHTTAINELNTDVTNLMTDKADVNNGNQTIIAGTVNATNINKNGVDVATVNDIPDITGKVNIAQGVENAGKVLGINNSGNVVPVTVESGGEVWEEVDLYNLPTDWVVGDRIKLILNAWVEPNFLNDKLTFHLGKNGTINEFSRMGIIEIEIPSTSTRSYLNLHTLFDSNGIFVSELVRINNHTAFNNKEGILQINGSMMLLSNGSLTKGVETNTMIDISKGTGIYKMWRLKK